ncbi:dNA mismatch repair protein MutL [Clostridium sp. CAG:389]|nr:dNA mismatch repair protein MutL [Clostridium sp. CAG:389]
MGNIVLLDDLTINKIAAGEVIERPANVVKELVENSIDAGANKIVIEVKNGGKTFIKITDNGKGISQEDMPISLERHATSKIQKIEDLEKTYTMGFRGEALASISAISTLTMQSKTKEEFTGTKIVAKAGNIIEAEECGMQVGTTILVENLFFNTPVRYKFLKQDATEFRYIKDWVQKVALANPNISFRLLNDGKSVFFTNGNGNIFDIIYLMYGKEIKENLLEVNYESDNIKVTGVIGNTIISRDNRKEQILFLNKRNIKNNVLINSADQAFKGGVGIGKYGFYILNLDMPADFYDVNVHPTKMEVRFKDEDKIYKVLYHAIKSTMLKFEFLGNNENEEHNEEYIQNELDFLTNEYENKAPNEIGYNINNIETDKNQRFELRKREESRTIKYKYLGILFRTFIIIEVENELFLIDQHAAHERVLYEKIKENYKQKISQNSQMMLIPEVINLTHREMEFVKNNMELFINTGFDIELFGENSIKINGIPDLEYKAKTQNIFMDILDEMLTNERTSIKDVEERFIATVACKAAVKANMDLSKPEVENLIQSLLSLNNPYTCPHGRPTTIKISKEYLEEHL